LKSEVSQVSEIRDHGDGNCYRFQERMKDYIVAPRLLQMNEKRICAYPLINCCGVTYTTNYPWHCRDAVAAADKD
jgi:hypothetical protein